MKDLSKSVFKNTIVHSVYKSGLRRKSSFIKKFGDDSSVNYNFTTQPNNTLSEFLNVDDLILSETPTELQINKNVIVGNIRMGYGHYRISIALASCANALGYKPLWLDLNAFPQSTTTKIVRHMNGLYSLGSRLSQKFSLFNKYYWEPLNSEGFRKITYNSKDQKMTELMAGFHANLPKDIPYIATHVWPAQAAVHAGFKRVVNIVPDNWQMGLHLSEGAIHAIQGFSTYLGYRTLNGMAKNILNPMPATDIVETGHFIDHEFVCNLEVDTEKRMQRLNQGKPLRLLLTVGGAGAQQKLTLDFIEFLAPYIQNKKVVLFVNVGDHKKFLNYLLSTSSWLKSNCTTYINEWDKTKQIAAKAIDGDVEGIHLFQNDDLFEAVYTTNLLIRPTDILITKPSELSFYPVPKLLIKRVGGHEAWGAIRSSELGDGTIECDKTDYAFQMLKLMIEEKDILKLMNNHILDNHKIGIYNGGYNAVKLAFNV